MVARSNIVAKKQSKSLWREDMVVLQKWRREEKWYETGGKHSDTTKWREKGMDFVPIVSKDLKDTSPFS
jgi:hypothetical protein